MQAQRVSWRAWWIGCFVAACSVAEAGTVAAQTIIDSVTPASRRVTLTWTRAPGDTFHTAALDPAVAAQLGLGVAANVPAFNDTARCVPQEGERLFAGYKVWRKATFDSDFVLLRKFGLCDTLYAWGFRDLGRAFVDPDSIFPRVGRMDEDDSDPTLPIPGPFDGFDYQYSVTSYDLTLVGSAVHEIDTPEDPADGAWPSIVQPNSNADEAIPFLDRVRVVPNPYQEGDALWSAQAKIQFQNLPQKATVRIYTTAGDLVKILEHDGGQYRFGSKDWDLKNGDGRDIVPGVYLYHVTTPSGEEATGQFVIVR